MKAKLKLPDNYVEMNEHEIMDTGGINSHNNSFVDNSFDNARLDITVDESPVPENRLVNAEQNQAGATPGRGLTGGQMGAIVGSVAVLAGIGVILSTLTKE